MAKRTKSSNNSKSTVNTSRQKVFPWKGVGIAGVVVALFIALYMVQPPSDKEDVPLDITPPAQVPERYQTGMHTFQKSCIQCHGEWAEGSEQGPPLLHDYYKPSHHADISFYRAVANGVRAHHWSYGNMPPIPGVSQKDMAQIIAFLRWWQRENGIGVAATNHAR